MDRLLLGLLLGLLFANLPGTDPVAARRLRARTSAIAGDWPSKVGRKSLAVHS